MITMMMIITLSRLEWYRAEHNGNDSDYEDVDSRDGVDYDFGNSIGGCLNVCNYNMCVSDSYLGFELYTCRRIIDTVQ